MSSTGCSPDPGAWFGWRPPPLRLSRRVCLGHAAAWLLYAVRLRHLSWPPFPWFDISNLA